MPKVTAELFREKDFEKALDGQQVKGMCQVTNGKDKTMELTKKAKSGCSTKTGALKADFAKVCLEKVVFQQFLGNISVGTAVETF